MQQVRVNRETLHESINRERGPRESPVIVHTELSSLVNDYTHSQQHYNDRLESLEREMASLKGQVTQSFVPVTTEHESKNLSTSKKPPHSARIISPPRMPAATSVRKLSNEDIPIIATNDGPFSRSLPLIPASRSRHFPNGILHPPSSPPTNSSEEGSYLRSYKAHMEQILRKDSPFSDLKVPNYTSIEDVMRANEQLLLENDRLRAELNRLKAESILLLRSMRATTGLEPNLGNERISAERERQELAIELARQVEENKRLRRSLVAQSEKFLTLRESLNVSDTSLSTSNDQRFTPESATQSLTNVNRIQQQQSKSARFVLISRSASRPRTFNQGSHDPS